MTLNEQIAVEEGWRFQEGEPPRYGGTYLEQGWFSPHGSFQHHLPRFDTCHDAILPLIRRTFTEPLSRATFAAHLLRIVGHDIFSLATATAEQLCRAFLASVGKEGK